MNSQKKQFLCTASVVISIFASGCASLGSSQKEIYSKTQNQNKMADLEKKALSKDLQDAEITELFLAADVLVAEKNFAAATGLYAAVFEADPNITVGLKLSRMKRLSGNDKEAEDIIKKLKLLFPKHYEPPLELATLYLAKKNHHAALKELETAYKQLPQSEELALAYIDSLIELKQRAKAKLILAAALKTNPMSDILLLRSVRLKAEDKDYLGAKNDLNILMRTSPDNIETWTLAGLIASEEGNYEAAERYFREAFERRPESDTLARYFVLQLIKQEKYEEARRILLKLEASGEDDATNSPSQGGNSFDPELRYQLAFVSMQLDEFTDARTRFVALLPLTSDKGRLYYYIGQCDELSKNQTGAIEQYNKIESSSVFYELAQQRLFMIEIDQGRADLAKTRLAEMESLKQNSEEDFRFVANAYAKLKNYKKAQDVLKTGLKKFPKSADLAYFIAAYTEFTESRRASVAKLDVFVKQNPTYTQALNHLGYTLAEMGERLPYAEQLLRKALAKEPKNAFYLDSLGWILFKQKKYSEAESALTQATQLEKDEPIVFEHLGELKYAQQDYANALKHFQRSEQIYLTKPAWKIDADSEWKNSYANVRKRILEIRRMALPARKS